MKKTFSNTNHLYDMSGNVKEWCWDRYGKSTPAGGTNPTGPVDGEERTLRGGDYFDFDSEVTCADRGHLTPDVKYKGLGLRVVKRP